MTLNVNRLLPILLVLGFGAVISFAAAPDSRAPAAVILKVKGKVSLLLSASSQEGTTAKVGDMILPGVSIKTGEDGLAMIKMLEDNSIVRVAPRSSLVVRPPAGNNGEARKVRVDIGSVFFNISKKMSGKRFDVETPTSVATVKGTRFWIIIGTNGSVSVLTLEGLLSLLNLNTKEARDVGPGETGKITGNIFTVTTTDPRDIPEDVLDRNLKIRFKDDKGGEKELNIDFEDVK